MLDSQLLELRQRQALLERQQADQVDLTRLSRAGDRNTEIQVRNDSTRPVRDVACVAISSHGKVAAQADLTGELRFVPARDGQAEFWAAMPGDAIHDWRFR